MKFDLTAIYKGLSSAIKLGWPAVKSFLISHFKGEFVKLALKKVLGTAAAGGLKGWLVKLIANELFEELAEPVVKAVLRKGKYQYDRLDGKITVIKLNQAEQKGDNDSYDDIITDSFK